jgi:predicted nucleic acid-binding protein
MALFDTDVLIDNLLNRYGASQALIKFKDEKNYCSVVTIGEILFGMYPGEKEKTLKLLDSLAPLEVDKDVVLSAYEIKNKARGFNLELFDCIIAATAIQNDMVLVTKNAKHYPDKRIKIYAPQY